MKLKIILSTVAALLLACASTYLGTRYGFRKGYDYGSDVAYHDGYADGCERAAQFSKNDEAFPICVEGLEG